MKKSKQIMASLLVMAMAVAGILSTSEVNAAETTAVDYEQLQVSSENWNKDGSIAPTRQNYVFGGWFKLNDDNTTYTALKKTDIDSNSDGTVDYTGDTYAKWVPAYVLSVKAQIDTDTQSSSGTTSEAFLRVISAVDSTDYNEVGFELYYDKTIPEEENTKITKVYESIQNKETGTTPWTPEEVFGAAADYFSVLRVDDISSGKYGAILYVKPYWVTMDGTRVTGLSKYVRVMDGYDNNPLISVPVSLLEGSDVAVGMLQMSYDSRLKFAGFEPGMLLKDMAVDSTEVGVVKLLGSTDVGDDKELTNVDPASEIYANVWFEVVDKTTDIDSIDCTFEMSNLSFCDWAEADVTDVKAWSVSY